VPDWRFYGGTPRGERFSPAAQITPANVARLEPAWVIRTGDLPRAGENEHGYEFSFEATPIQVGDTLFLCTPHRRILALDGRTGAVRWKFDPQPDVAYNAYLACRGVAYAEVDGVAADAPCRQRIVSTTADARLFALDARTGALCRDFGDGGYVSLREHLGDVPAGFHFITSQPLVARGKVLLGGWIYDGQKTGEPSGVVRAFDVRTGALAWAWDLGRADPAVEHPAAGETFTPGTPNAWGTYTADLDLGLVFLPLGNAVPDYFGSRRRPFDERYSSAVVALDIDTGRERWHFQTLHHDLWDMDVPIGPTLVDVPGPDGTRTPALLQTTKRGELFLLDRRDGHPLAPVVERPAPTDALPEERAAMSPTQPYSAGMPSFAPPPVRESDAWGATPFDQLLCRIDFRRMHYEGAYTPITTTRTLVYPSFDGIVDWQGASVDPRTHRLVANLSYIPFTGIAIPRAQAESQGLVQPWDGRGQPPRPKDFSINPQYGTPYVVVVKPWLNFLGVPCKAPPWGRLAEVDLDARRLRWLEEVGTTRDMGLFKSHVNLPLTTGIFNIAGSLVTGSGLVFMGATADDWLRAFDEADGRELWKARLPAGGQATPMTYVASDGRQYVVIAAGGHGGLGTRPGDYVVAYALPR
jgi:quinoprotein glucose dehydrogenase